MARLCTSLIGCLGGFPLKLCREFPQQWQVQQCDRVPITYGNDVLSIMPATLDEITLRDRIAVADAAVIIKLGRHFAKVRKILDELGLLHRALYIERATQPNQQIIPITEVDPAEVPYWSLILIPSQTQPQ